MYRARVKLLLSQTQSMEQEDYIIALSVQETLDEETSNGSVMHNG